VAVRAVCGQCGVDVLDHPQGVGERRFSAISALICGIPCAA
jgi:hypothetical protein